MAQIVAEGFKRYARRRRDRRDFNAKFDTDRPRGWEEDVMRAALLALLLALGGCQIFETTVPVHKRPVPVVSRCTVENGVQICRKYDRKGERRYDCERGWSRCAGL